jgi:hypothetical protein
VIFLGGIPYKQDAWLVLLILDFTSKGTCRIALHEATKVVGVKEGDSLVLPFGILIFLDKENILMWRRNQLHITSATTVQYPHGNWMHIAKNK